MNTDIDNLPSERTFSQLKGGDAFVYGDPEYDEDSGAYIKTGKSHAVSLETGRSRDFAQAVSVSLLECKGFRFAAKHAPPKNCPLPPR
jgi:hypothetical protein